MSQNRQYCFGSNLQRILSLVEINFGTITLADA